MIFSLKGISYYEWADSIHTKEWGALMEGDLQSVDYGSKLSIHRYVTLVG